MSVYQDIIVSMNKALLTITFNRPSKKNAININMYKEITKALNEAAANSKVLVTALTGAGDFYSSGNDLAGVMDVMNSTEDVSERLKDSMLTLEAFIEAFITFPKLLIAVVNGPCIGIAATSAALCDVIYASETAYFQTPFTAVGLNMEGCSSYTFPRILGTSKATEMLILNHKLTAREALQFGFVSEIFATKDIHKIWTRLEAYSKLPHKSVIYSKELVKRFDLESLRAANRRELDRLDERRTSEDSVNAMVSFFNRKSKM